MLNRWGRRRRAHQETSSVLLFKKLGLTIKVRQTHSFQGECKLLVRNSHNAYVDLAASLSPIGPEVVDIFTWETSGISPTV